MIIRTLFATIICLCLTIHGLAQERSGYVYDVDSLPLYKQNAMCEYVTAAGEKLTAYLSADLHFAEGRDSLNRYVRRLFYNQEDYDGEEYHQRVYFYILFDRELNIVEVRQIPPQFMHKPREYNRLFSEILKSTSGMWRNDGVAGKDWYVTLYTIYGPF